jgi:hypothetical protein
MSHNVFMTNSGLLFLLVSYATVHCLRAYQGIYTNTLRVKFFLALSILHK